MLDQFQWPTEWDWNWGWFAFYAGGMFSLGLLMFLFGLPGIIPLVAGAVMGACAGSWEWFER